MSRQYEITVIGAGIAGLTTAIALTRAGHTVHIYEQQEHIKPVGAGLILWSNAVNALRALDLEETVLDIGNPLANLSILNPAGQTLARTDAGLIGDRVGSPTLAVHRADLLSLLQEQLPADVVHTDRQFERFEQHDGRVTAFFADGSDATADILIGADGLWSRVREQIHGKRPPRYSGYTAWRAVVQDQQIIDSNIDHTTETWGCGTRFGWVPMSEGRIYWFAVRNAPEREEVGPEGHRAELFDLFEGWHAPIPETILTTPEENIMRHDIYDRPPIPQWGTGSITLAGDAAHPMTPNTGQGAVQAIEDSVVLADCLERYITIDSALRGYESTRTPRTTHIVNLSHRIGQIVAIENRMLCSIRDAVARLTPDSMGTRQIQNIVEWQAPNLKGRSG